MEIVVIYYDNKGDEYSNDMAIKEFNSEDEMMAFINGNDIGSKVVKIYEIQREIKIVSYKKIIQYKIEGD